MFIPKGKRKENECMQVIKSTPNLTKQQLYQLTASLNRMALQEKQNDELIITEYVEYIPTTSVKTTLAMRTAEGVFVTNSQAFIDNFDCCLEFNPREDDEIHIKKVRRKSKSGGYYYLCELITD